MTLVENISPDAVELFNVSTVDLTDDAVHQEDEVENTLTAQVKKV